LSLVILTPKGVACEEFKVALFAAELVALFDWNNHEIIIYYKNTAQLMPY
jgi:hypothetical protein